MARGPSIGAGRKLKTGSLRTSSRLLPDGRVRLTCLPNHGSVLRCTSQMGKLAWRMKQSNEAEIAEAFHAAFDGDIDAIRRFAESGADLNMSAYRGSFLLRVALQAPGLKALRTLLELGADPNKQFDYYSPVTKKTAERVSALFYALDVESAEALVEFGANVNIRNARGSTPLMCAANSLNPDLVEYLLGRGADPSLRQHPKRGRKAQTALEIAEGDLAMWESIYEADKKPILRDKLKAAAHCRDSQASESIGEDTIECSATDNSVVSDPIDFGTTY